MHSETIRYYLRRPDGYFYTSGRHFQTRTRVFIGTVVDSGQVYRDESMAEIAQKASGLILFSPAYTACAMAGNVALGLTGRKNPLKAAYDACKAPFFGTMLFASSCYTALVNPIAGRTWIDWTEKRWHGGDLAQDVRYGKSPQELEDISCIKEIFINRKILYAGFCMQSFGNINDMVKGKPKFEIID